MLAMSLAKKTYLPNAYGPLPNLADLSHAQTLSNGRDSYNVMLFMSNNHPLPTYSAATPIMVQHRIQQA
jgi:hypothetical protein|nr:hypothetical protein Q903MT_gene1658 [Picea sitchensis]